MNSKIIVESIIKSKNGIAKVADLVEGGVSRQSIKKMYADGYIKKISRGYYTLTSEPVSSDEQVISSIIPKSVVCMESALFYYGYSDFMPRVKTVAVPRSASRKTIKVSPVPLKVYYVTDGIYELGKVTAEENGISFSIYDRERTVCDIFKHREKIDSETFAKALNAYAKDEKKNLNNLSDYAKKLRVHKKVTELMEVLLNG